MVLPLPDNRPFILPEATGGASSQFQLWGTFVVAQPNLEHESADRISGGLVPRPSRVANPSPGCCPTR